MDKDEKKFRHLEFIQEAIKRMAANSFSYKQWAITVFSALITINISFLNKGGKELDILLLTIFIIFIFWVLDSWFLRQERLFRDFYDEVRKSEKDMGYKISTDNFNQECLLRTLFRAPNGFLYIALLLATTVLHFLIF
ncbi:MAG: hypothetical protein V2A63_04120 [Patescibacteria group bacterium]